MLLRLLATLFTIASWMGAGYAGEEVEFSLFLAGCWQHGEIPTSTGRSEEIFMTQTCFEAAIDGEAAYFTCHGFGTFDCRETAERFFLADGKVHFVANDGAEQVCDAQVVPEKTLRLLNCEGPESSFVERVFVRVDRP